MTNHHGLGIGSIEPPEDDSNEKEAAEEDSMEEPQSDEQTDEEDVPDVAEGGEIIGEEAGTFVGKNNVSGKNREVPISCGATACIFNREGHCNADEIRIEIGNGQGAYARGTYCATFQTAGEDTQD